MPIKTPAYYHIPVEAAATVNGVEVDVFQLSVSYPVNGIPTGYITVPYGYKANTRKPGQGKAISDTATMRSVVEVFLRLGENAKWKKIFRGYVTGTSADRSGRHASARLNMIHWLDDLQVSSALSASMTPAAMAQIEVLPVAFGLDAGADQANSIGSLGISDDIVKYMGSEDEPDVLLALRRGLALFSGAVTPGGRVFNNEPAQAAARLVSGKLNLSFATDPSIRGGIAREITSVFRYVYSGATLWRSLVALTNSLLYALVPSVEAVYVVPYTPVLNGARYEQRIDSNEFVYVRMEEQTRPALRGIQLYTTAEAVPTGILAGDPRKPAAKYIISDKVGSGLIDAALTPQWLASPVEQNMVQYTYAKGQAGRARAEAKQAVETAIPDRTGADSNKVGTALAAALLYERIVAPNSAGLVGPINFNIGPGTLLRARAPMGESESDDIADLYSYVRSVTIHVDSINVDAHMELGLSHFHGLADREIGPMLHPLYKDVMIQSNITAQPIYRTEE